MENQTSKRVVLQVAALSLIIGGITIVPSAAYADSGACNEGFADVPGEVIYNGNGVDVNLPAKLHGKTVHLMNGRAANQSYATVDNPSPGDIISIDRATDSDKLNTTKKWWRTNEIGGWEYCQANTNSYRRTPTMNNWHIPMRVCLRHNGALQCSNIWYADQT
jgi:hypothetical protein